MAEVSVALGACLVYVVVSLIVGDRFPFSRYSMYASLTQRQEGAVLYVRVGERFVAPDELVAVHGLDVAALNPRRVPCSQEWIVHEAMRWLDNHAVDEEQPLPVEVGYRMLRIEPDGSVSMRLSAVTRGTGALG